MTAARTARRSVRGRRRNRVMFGPHVTNLGDDDRRFTAPPRRLLRAPGPRRVRDDRRRGRQRPRLATGRTSGRRWPTRAADGWAAIVDACRRPRRARHRLARPRRRAGLVGVQPARRCGRRRACPRSTRARCPKWMEADDIAAVVAGFAAAAARGRRRRLRRRRDQRRPAQPGAPVPVRADEPARRRVGRRPPALRPRGASPRCARRVGADRVVGLRLSCDELAPWAGITPDMAPAIAAELVGVRRRLRRRRARRDLLDRADPARLPPADRLQHRAGQRDQPPPSTVPVFLQGSIVERRPGRVGGRRYDDPARAPASR